MLFAYQVTQTRYLPQATVLRAALETDARGQARLYLGREHRLAELGGNSPAPPVILTVTHDTGYPIRWYGPYVALAYDWLSPAPGFDAGLLAQARTCLTAWSDYYTAKGYHHDEAGANYNAGFIIGKTLTAIAIGNDGGADGHLWNEIVDDQFQTLLIGQGLAGMTGNVGTPAGALVGGDWAEGWQYGPLSVLEYAVSARAIEENGASLPEMAAWTNSLAVRYIHATVPALDGQWVGGDYDNDRVYQSPATNEVDAVLAGPSSDEAASWALSMKAKQSLGGGGYFYNALAELRGVTAADFTAQSPAPALWYVARGTRALYARTAWGFGGLLGRLFQRAGGRQRPRALFGVEFRVHPRLGSSHRRSVDVRRLRHLIDERNCRGLRRPQETTRRPRLRGAKPSSSGLAALPTLSTPRAAGLRQTFKFSGTPGDIPTRTAENG